MSDEKLILDGFEFQSKSEYDIAKKELEKITYMKSNSNWQQPKVAIKLYNKLLEKDNLHTLIGYEFLKELRNIVIANKIIDETSILTIKVAERRKVQTPQAIKKSDETLKYKLLYEKASFSKKLMKIIIGFLIFIIIGMAAITYMSSNNTFYLKQEEKIVNKYEQWQLSLEKKENELIEREKAILEKETNLGN